MFPSAPGRLLPLDDEVFTGRLQAFLNTRQVICAFFRSVWGFGGLFCPFREKFSRVEEK